MDKKNFYLFVLEELQKGKNPAQISKEHNISKQKLNYYLRKLKEKDLAQKVGYGVWNVVKRSKKQPQHTQTLQEVRGHAFIWKIKIPKSVVTNWIPRLVALRIPYKITGIQKVPMIIVNERKVLLGQKSIVIYENKGFLGENAIKARVSAIDELKDILDSLEAKLNINLYPHLFTVRREHYALMNNLLAKHSNDTKSPIKVRDINGYWLLTDDSLNQDELENIGKEAFNINIPMQNWWNDHKKQGFKATPSFLMGAIKQNADNLNDYAVHLKAHVESVKELGIGVNKMTSQIGELTKLIKDLKK